MSVYEQLAPKTRRRRQRETINDDKLDEQAEEVEKEEDDDEYNKGSSAALQVRFINYYKRNFIFITLVYFFSIQI
jgi:uncharacterized membrane protein